MAKTALLIGATGLTGSILVKKLIDDDRFDCVKVIVRKDLGFHHKKLQQFIIDFNTIMEYLPLLKADVLFICIGTTMRKAKSVEAFRKVDFEIPKEFIEAAVVHKTTQVGLISSVGANADSKSYYLKTKGDLELYLQAQEIEKTYILRPASLVGSRTEFRLLEKISVPLLKIFSIFLQGRLKKYRPIKAEKVAECLYQLVLDNADSAYMESDQIQSFR